MIRRMTRNCYVWQFVYVVLLHESNIGASEDVPLFSNRKEEVRTGLYSSIQGFANSEIFQTFRVESQVTCVSTCLTNPKCQSVNYQIDGDPEHLCELSEQAFESTDDFNIKDSPGYVHVYAIQEYLSSHPCSKGKCKNGAICVLERSARNHRCACGVFNKGESCNQWTVNVTSCMDIYTKTSHRKDMAYTYMIDNKQTDIYCHLSSDLCGSRGWTMAIKTDGSKQTFAYSSALWSNKNTYQLSAGKTGFDSHETKMPSYWGVPFQSLCVGLKVGNNLNWALIPYKASSLYDVIADGVVRNFTIGRNKWMSLIGGSSLQSNCNAEGFNGGTRRAAVLRIGIRGNQEDDCNTPDSAIGFGIIWEAVSCGNRCRLQCNNGARNTIAFGYILIK